MMDGGRFVGKLTVLRMCNSLLRKLSKSCNTEVSSL